MIARILGLVLCCLVWWGLPLLAWGDEWGHSSPQWRSLGRGLSFAEVQVFLDGEVVEDLAVVKVDPANNAFRVFHHAPQSITVWQQEIKAPVVFNASYYTPQGKPVGLIMVDGKAIGPRRNRQMRGMFVAEPKGMSPDLPRATILDLVSGSVDPRKLPWTQGVQSFPLLLDYKGRVRVASTEKTAHRTVIATDRNGNILIFNTGNAFFTLYDFAQFLKASAFGIDSALNLDGGTEAQLYIKMKDFEYFSPPAWKSRLGNLYERQQFWLPTVIGVFPRRD